MYPRSDDFDEQLIEGGIVSTRVDVYRGGVKIYEDLPIAPGGQVTVDGTAAARRRLRCSVIDSDGSFIPTDQTDLLAPYGNELVVAVGFNLSDTGVERVPMGVFRIEDVNPRWDGLIEIDAVDRSTIITRAVFESPYNVATATPSLELGAVIHDIINSRFAGLTYNFPVTTITVPGTTTFLEGVDPWQSVQQLAASNGMEVFFDVNGAVVLQPIPDPTLDSPVWFYRPDNQSIILRADSRQSSRDAINVVVVTGEGSGVTTPVRATAEITDSTSPVFPATFGRRPFFFSSPTITTTAQAQDAANNLLLQKAGTAEIVAFVAVPHPAHDASDVVYVENERLGLARNVVLSQFTIDIGLAAEAVYATRGQRSIT